MNDSVSDPGNRQTEGSPAARPDRVRRAPANPLVSGSDAKVSVRGLEFFYGRTKALHGIDLDIKENAITALIGPSGCGKSTFIRCINRIYELYPGHRATGSIMLDGEDILGRQTDPTLLRKKVGMVFQKATPFPMSIYENIAFGVRLYERLGRSRMAERVEAALRKAALWEETKDKLHRSGLQLSGGQQQRLCIARAIAIKPEVLLLDEPCSALDPTSTLRVEELIDELKQEYTIVIVTHNMQQAGRVSDFTAFMYMGQLIEFNETDKMFNNPERRETEDYITGRFG